MAIGETIFSSETLNQGRIKINNVFSGTSAIWSSSTGTDSVIQSNATGNLGNLASGTNSIAAGKNNSATATYSTVVGGLQNKSSGTYSTVIGGKTNLASGSRSFVGGGDSNSAITSYSSIVGGIQNSVSGSRSFIGGGRLNSATTSYSCIVGGLANLTTGSQSFIGGGYNNINTGTYSSIIGGLSNIITGELSFIVGGRNNSATTNFSAVVGGYKNRASGAYSSILGGKGNASLHTHSIAIGGGSQTRANFDLVLGATDTVTPSVDNNTIHLEGTGGNIKMDGSVSSPEADYSEFFEFEDGNPNNEDRKGYFVSLVGDKVKIGNESIIGIVSVSPSIIGDAAPNHWSKMNVKDIWGVNIKEQYKVYKLDNKQIYVDIQNNPFTEYPNPSNPKGIIFSGSIPNAEYVIKEYNKINPDFDNSVSYYDRSKRKEWAPIGLLGKLYVRTAENITSKFVDVNTNGMAINGTKYPVLNTIREFTNSQYGIVRVFFK